MSIEGVLRKLNQLKQRRVLRDYAIMGGVAAAAYMEPMFTEDIDIIVLADTDEEFFRQYKAAGEEAEGMEGMHQVISGTPVQLSPSTTKPLYRDALKDAKTARVGTIRTKVVSAEHLILMMLEANRPKDHFRTRIILESANQDHLHACSGGSTMPSRRLPGDSKRFLELVYAGKQVKAVHRRSLAERFRVLDRLIAERQTIARLTFLSDKDE